MIDFQPVWGFPQPVAQSVSFILCLLNFLYFPINHCTYAPDNEWFIETMNTVFSLGGDMMQPDIPNSFLKLLSEGEKPTRSNDSAVIFLLTDMMLID